MCLPHGLMAELSAITNIVKVLLCDDLINNRLMPPSGHLKTTKYAICYTNSYKINRFKIIKTCSNVFDLIKLEAVCILLRKPVSCKQKDFDYTVSLFS